ncbi:hypothetical protein ID866_4552 [Astraeus odoratus]|nr:hypothetical protein ID866_4552 [Astraeus odoratus]
MVVLKRTDAVSWVWLMEGKYQPLPRDQMCGPHFSSSNSAFPIDIPSLKTVYNAIKAGYRLFDGACDYGNEKEAGEGVRRALKEGIVKREELFITSKLWNTFHAYEHVKMITKKQLDLWGIDYFDLFLVHFPVSLRYVDPSHRYPPEWWGDDGKVHLQNTPMHETWKAMEELVDEGLAKNIGLSNCQGSLVLDVMQYARYEPQVLQVELHPYLSQQPLVDLCKQLGIAVTAYSSFGPQSYLELGMGKTVPSLLNHDMISTIASAHGKARISSLNVHLRMNNPADIDPRLAIFA